METISMHVSRVAQKIALKTPGAVKLGVVN